MFIFLLFVIPAVLAADNPSVVRYLVYQQSVIIIASPKGSIKFTEKELSWPSFVEFIENIDKNSGINVVVGFGNGTTKPFTYKKIAVDHKNLCTVLDEAIDNVAKGKTDYKVAEMLGLFGTRCPILKGTRNMVPYNFPTLTTLENLGTGKIDFIITLEKKSVAEPLVTLIATLNLTYWDDRTRASTSIAPAISSALGFHILVVLVTLFIAK